MFDVITIGNATRDIFLSSKAFHILKEPHILKNELSCFVLGSKIEVEEAILTTGGGATNAAVSYSLKGLKVACLAPIGNDLNGKEIKEELAKYNVDPIFLQIYDDAKTDFSVILHVSSGERTILVYKNASYRLSKDNIDWTNLKQTKWFSINHLHGDFELLAGFLNFARENNIFTSFNPGEKEIEKGFDFLKSFLENINILFVNREEATAILKTDENDIKKILKSLKDAVRDLVVITDARNGVYLTDGKDFYRAGIFKEKEILDRTGAGDAFASGFLSAIILSGKNPPYEEAVIKESLRVASANATSVIEQVGAKNGLLKKEELNEPRWAIKNLEIKKEML